jgi:hypothetical protein
MNNEALKLLGRFKILVKKEKGLGLDLEKLMAHPQYARHVLELAEDSTNQALLSLTSALRTRLGLSDPGPVSLPPQTVAPVAADKRPAGKYKLGARS